MTLLHQIVVGIAAAQAAPPAPPVIVRTVPPVTGSARRDSPPRIASFVPGDVRCGGSAVVPERLEPPFPAGASFLGIDPPPPVRLRFRISADGRPLSIERVREAQSVTMDSRDLIPSLAASKFPAGAERLGCEISYEIQPHRVTTADPALLHRYVALVHRNQAGFDFGTGRAVVDRLKSADSTCFDPGPTPRQVHFPDFNSVPQMSGTASYVFIGYDIDASGRPHSLRVLSSSGNQTLDRTSLDAVGRSRFATEARKGCAVHFFRQGSEPLQPPTKPRDKDVRPKDSNCPEDRPDGWAHLPPLVFPPEFQRRNIEGWAMIRYDVAPWGAVGNVSVIAAEPASAFGEAAANIVRQGRKPETEHGYRGCVVGLRFVLPERGTPRPES